MAAPRCDRHTALMEPTTRTNLHPALRALIATLVAAAAGWGTLVAWFISIVEYTGCFISCSEPSPLIGIGLMAVAASLLGSFVAAIGFAFIGWRRERLLRLWLIGAGAGAILGIASLVAS